MTTPTADKSPVDQIIDTLDDRYSLVYTAGDYLSDNQVSMLVRGEMDDLYDAVCDDWSETRAQAALELATEAIDIWTGEHPSVEVDDSELEDEVRFAIEDRDDSTPLDDAMANTHCPLLRVQLITEDDDCNVWGHTPPAHYLRAAGLPVTSRTVETMRALIAHTPSDLHEGWVVFRADVGALFDTAGRPDSDVTVTDPTIILGNGFTGGYWHGKFTGCRITVRRGDIRLDSEGGAWSVDDCYGGFPLDGPDAEM